MKILKSPSSSTLCCSRKGSNAQRFLFLLLVTPCLGKSLAEVEPILFAGDSDIEFWENTNSEYPNSVNKGDAGSTCKEWVERIDERMNEFQPTTVVLVCGENDLWDDSPSVVFSNFKKIVSKISAKGASVIYLGTKPEPFTEYIHAEYREYDAMIRDHYGQNQQEPLVMIDVYPSFVELGNPNSLYANDRLHLSQQGYGFWNSWLKAALNDSSGCLRWESGKCTLTSNSDDNNNDDNDTQPTSAPTLTSNNDDDTPSSTSASLNAFRFSWYAIFFCIFTGQFFFFSF